MTKDPRRFYVYDYLRSKDSERGVKYSPYYIGKGCGKRAFEKYGRTVPAPVDNSYIVFVEEGLTEAEAFSLETYCIQLHGRIDLGNGILRNRTDGGDGASGSSHSQEARNKISQARMGNQHALGRQHTEDAKRKISQSKQKYLYEFTNSIGEIYIVDNAREFAEQYRLSHGNLTQVIHGKRKHHKGWTGRILEALK